MTTEVGAHEADSVLPPGARTVPERRRAGRSLAWWRGLREIVMIVVLWLAYSAGRHLADLDLPVADRHARALLHTEQLLHIDIESWLNHATTDVGWLALPMCFWYAALHYTVTPAVLAFVYIRHRGDYSRVRNALVMASAAALIVYIFLPTAPPRLMPSSYGYVDTMAQYASHGWWSAHASAPAGMQQLTNEYAAMPSLHVGWTVWVAWVLRRTTGRVGGAVGVVYVLGTSMVVLSTANHWLLDILVGAAFVVGGILVSNRLERWKDDGGGGRLRARLSARRPSSRDPLSPSSPTG